MTPRPNFRDVGLRLMAIRKGFSSISQKDWAEKHSFQPTQWNNSERGTRRIPIDDAIKLSDLYGLTLDYIYRGRRDGMSERASHRLQ